MKVKLTREMWENYKHQVETSIRTNTMAIESDNALLDFINKKIANTPKEKKDAPICNSSSAG